MGSLVKKEHLMLQNFTCAGYQYCLEKNLIVGGGIRISYRIICPKVVTTHPHNYYLEILAELGS